MSPTVDDGVGPGSRQVTELTRQSYPMRKLAISLFILDVALSFLSSCSSSSKAEPQLSGPIGIVRFPDPWVKVIGDTTRDVNDNIGYVIRKSGPQLSLCNDVIDISTSQGQSRQIYFDVTEFVRIT